MKQLLPILIPAVLSSVVKGRGLYYDQGDYSEFPVLMKSLGLPDGS